MTPHEEYLVLQETKFIRLGKVNEHIDRIGNSIFIVWLLAYGLFATKAFNNNDLITFMMENSFIKRI